MGKCVTGMENVNDLGDLGVPSTSSMAPRQGDSPISSQYFTAFKQRLETNFTNMDQLHMENFEIAMEMFNELRV